MADNYRLKGMRWIDTIHPATRRARLRQAVVNSACQKMFSLIISPLCFTCAIIRIGTMEKSTICRRAWRHKSARVIITMLFRGPW
ncbi:hypothetical protein EHW64_04405 [Erwinia psidii]|uniref:hypothetical protein n=1 Tax=Erwinia psidii TaxID=69224 RepID=UPI00226B1410|nr:hypothetical protein [Erwinia psidii]MCX8960435.1 hypothetical protein [Erwinia psidii]